MGHLLHVICQMSLQEQPQQQTLTFVTPTQCMQNTALSFTERSGHRGATSSDH